MRTSVRLFVVMMILFFLRTRKISYAKIQSALTVLSQDGNNVVAVAKVGKRAVFAVGDPRFYNEYEDRRKIPMDFENYKASEDLAKWAIQQIK